MANVLSMDLRVRFKTLMEDGLCAAAAGKTLLLSRATAARWGKKVRDGEPLEPLPSGPRKGSGKLEPFHPFFVELIAQYPDITLVELQAGLLSAHDVRCSTSGIDALLRRHDYTYKKRGLIYLARRAARRGSYLRSQKCGMIAQLRARMLSSNRDKPLLILADSGTFYFNPLL